MSLRSSRRNAAGFTLIEVLIAILLFAVGALALAQLQTRNMKGTTFGKETLNAAAAAQATIEGLKRGRVNGAAVNLWAGNAAMNGNYSVTDIPGMQVQWNAEASNADQFRRISVTITWTTGNGSANNETYTFQTIISRA